MSTPATSSPEGETATRAGIEIARIRGIPILIAPTWFLFAAFVVFAYGPALADRLGSSRAYLAAASFALILLVSVLLHELGHALVARAFGLPVRRITVTFLAGFTEIVEPPQTPAREYAVAVVGPMVSLVLAGLGVAVAPLFDPDSLPHLLVLGAAVTNGIVAVFNLLPGLPLDGGRVLRAAVWRLTHDPHRSTVIAAWGGRVVALVVVPLLVLLVLPAVGLGRPTVSTALFTALIATFVFAGSTATLQHARVVARLPPGVVDRLARPALPVPADLPVSEAVRRAQESGLHAVVVVDSAGQPEAVVNEAAVVATPEHRRPWVPVSSLARHLGDAERLDPALSGEALLAAIQRNPAMEYLVRGEPLRVLSAADVAQLVQTRR